MIGALKQESRWRRGVKQKTWREKGAYRSTRSTAWTLGWMGAKRKRQSSARPEQGEKKLLMDDRERAEPLPTRPYLVVIRWQGRTLVSQKMFWAQWSLDRLKNLRGLTVVEAVGKIVCVRICVRILYLDACSNRRQIESLFDELQNAAEMVWHVRNIAGLRVW